MAQLTYDEIRLLRELRHCDRKVGSEPHRDLDRLVKEGYATTHFRSPSEALYSITAKGRAALHETEGND